MTTPSLRDAAPALSPEASPNPPPEPAPPPAPSGMLARADESVLHMPAPGEVLGGRYEIVKCVGLGGSCGVYKALDHKRLQGNVSEPCVALKVPRPRFRADPEWLQNFEAEASNVLGLRHQHIVQVSGINRDGDLSFIVMEFLQGVPLTERVRASDFRGMGWSEAKRIVQPVAAALTYVHTLGLVHCDVKPSNIFLTESGEPKLIDFGIARMVSKEPGAVSTANRQVTPAYASPEVLAGSPPDPRADVYSLACTAFELLTGKHPYDHRRATDALAAGAMVPRLNLPWSAWRVLRRALALEVAERTPTVQRFVRDLSAAYIPHNATALLLGLAAASLAGLWLTSERYPATPADPETGFEDASGPLTGAEPDKDSATVATEPEQPATSPAAMPAADPMPGRATTAAGPVDAQAPAAVPPGHPEQRNSPAPVAPAIAAEPGPAAVAAVASSAGGPSATGNEVQAGAKALRRNPNRQLSRNGATRAATGPGSDRQTPAAVAALTAGVLPAGPQAPASGTAARTEAPESADAEPPRKIRHASTF